MCIRDSIMQSLAASDALDARFDADPEAMRRLMHGLLSPDLEGAIPDVYDAMRAAGVGAGELRGFEMRGAAGLAELRLAVAGLGDENVSAWNASQVERLREVLEVALRVATLPDGCLLYTSDAA